jgi:glycosyltransferase involved in cell wall biosynthesis
MDIGIDCSCVAKPERTGVARYCASLLRALPGALAAEDRVRMLYRASRWRRRRWVEPAPDARFTVAWFNDKVLRVGAGGLDVVHGPDLRIPRLPGVPAVATVHDLSALDVEGVADARFREGKLAALADVAERAAAILCISEITEAAFLARFPQAAGRTRVVPLGLPERFGPQSDEAVRAVLARRGIARPYLLFVGQIAPRKNLGPLVAAWKSLTVRPSFADLGLVLAGPVLAGGDEILASATSPRVHALGFVGDDELPALYAGAAAFVFPSKAEGFGLPILEAMACGAPVIAARAGASPSTGGDAAVYADPDSADEFAAAVERLLTDDAARAAQVERGRGRAAAFTWAETARRTALAYRDAARTGVPA